MANNVEVTAGSGTTFKTTDNAGVHTGHVNVDNTVTISGTVTANLSATDNAVLDSIQTAVELIDNAISGSEMQVDVVSSALPTGAATAAKQPALGTAGTASSDVITVQGVASMTALVVDGSAVTQPVSGTVTANLSATDNTVLDNIEAGIDEVKVLLGEVQASPTENTVLERLKAIEDQIISGTIDAGTLASRSTDVLSVMPPVISTKAAVSGATSGDNTVVTAQGAGNSIVVHSLFLIAAGAVDVRFEDGAGGTALTGVMSLAANGGFVLPYNPDGWFETSDNTLLNMELGSAVQVSGGITYSVR